MIAHGERRRPAGDPDHAPAATTRRPARSSRPRRGRARTTAAASTRRRAPRRRATSVAPRRRADSQQRVDQRLRHDARIVREAARRRRRADSTAGAASRTAAASSHSASNPCAGSARDAVVRTSLGRRRGTSSSTPARSNPTSTPVSSRSAAASAGKRARLARRSARRAPSSSPLADRQHAGGGARRLAAERAAVDEQDRSVRAAPARARPRSRSPRRPRRGRRACRRSVTAGARPRGAAAARATSATMPMSAAFRMGAFGLLLIATMVPARRRPTMCSMAPLAASATYRRGAIARPVRPDLMLARQPAGVGHLARRGDRGAEARRELLDRRQRRGAADALAHAEHERGRLQRLRGVAAERLARSTTRTRLVTLAHVQALDDELARRIGPAPRAACPDGPSPSRAACATGSAPRWCRRTPASAAARAPPRRRRGPPRRR